MVYRVLETKPIHQDEKKENPLARNRPLPVCQAMTASASRVQLLLVSGMSWSSTAPTHGGRLCFSWSTGWTEAGYPNWGSKGFPRIIPTLLLSTVQPWIKGDFSKTILIKAAPK